MAKAKVLTKDEAKRVLRIAETLTHGQRDKLALALSIMGGMRVGAIPAAVDPFVIGRVTRLFCVGLNGKLSNPSFRGWKFAFAGLCSVETLA